MFALTVLLSLSCNQGYHQFYKDFSEYNTASLRQKSWFPPLISENCFDIRVKLYLDESNTTNYAFGVFSYTDLKKMTLALSDTNNKKINFESLQYCLVRIPPTGVPQWFIKSETIKSSDIYLNERFFVIDRRQNKQIYFVYDGSYRLYDTLNNKASKPASLN